MTFAEAVKRLNQKFTSANDIPVERATSLREEWEAINEAVKSQRQIPPLNFSCKCGWLHLDVYPGFKCRECGALFCPAGGETP